MTSSTASPSTWHSVNPQTRPLTLSILELTPLALTLSLTLASPLYTPSPHASSPSPAASKQRRKARPTKRESDDEHEDAEGDHSFTAPHSVLDSHTNFKDLLSHGVVVSVNGQPWNRIVAHVSDQDTDHEEEHGEGDEEEWIVEDEGEDTSNSVEEGVTKRRPRKARFGPSAGDAVKDSLGLAKAKRRTSESREHRRDRDRAVVVVYGLAPGKEYEIELRIVGLIAPESDPLVSNSVLIPSSPSPGISRSRANSLRSRNLPRSRSNSLNAPPHPNTAQHSSDSSIAASPGRVSPTANGNGSDTLSVAPIPTNILNPIDTQAAQIRHMIAAAHAEKEHVQTQIKEARRASQRAEAALRLEIETVKRATEKAGSLDLRAKQKALALQEQVKQGWAGAEHADEEAAAVENGHSDLEHHLTLSRADVEGVQAEWKVAKDSEDRAREAEKKTRTEEERKLAEVVGRIDKLRLKKDKKAAEKLELENKLRELVRQADEIERRNEEEAHVRRAGPGAAYWEYYGQHSGNHLPQQSQQQPQQQQQSQLGLPAALDGRTLTNHPSLNNLSYRGRGGYIGGGRYPSTGSVRPNATQPSPTQGSSFYTVPHPSNPLSSPAFRANASGSASSPKPSPGAVGVGGARSPSSSGVNVAAIPFHPTAYTPHSPSAPAPSATPSTSNSTPSGTSSSNGGDHTTLMPPQLQHRIYLSSGRPRPTPNFNPPPSVLAERQSPTIGTAPSFPPLPSSNASSNPGGPSSPTSSTSISSPSPLAGGSQPGASLATMVTRAVLSPTALAGRGIGSSGSAASSADGHGHPLASPLSPSQTGRASPAPDHSGSQYGSPPGPWNLHTGIVRTSTPPIRRSG